MCIYYSMVRISLDPPITGEDPFPLPSTMNLKTSLWVGPLNSFDFYQGQSPTSKIEMLVVFAHILHEGNS